MYAETLVNKLKWRKKESERQTGEIYSCFECMAMSKGSTAVNMHILSYFITSMRHYLNLFFPHIITGRLQCINARCTYSTGCRKKWAESCINNGKENVNLLCIDHCIWCCALRKKCAHTRSHQDGILCHCQRLRLAIIEIWDIGINFQWQKKIQKQIAHLMYSSFCCFFIVKFFLWQMIISYNMIHDKNVEEDFHICTRILDLQCKSILQ